MRLNRWNRRRGTWKPVRPLHLEADDARRAVDPPTPAMIALPPARIVHPTRPAPARKCYRVVRYFRQDDALQFEDLGGYDRPGDALLITTREFGRARVIGPDGKIYSDNWQPIEDRS